MKWRRKRRERHAGVVAPPYHHARWFAHAQRLIYALSYQHNVYGQMYPVLYKAYPASTYSTCTALSRNPLKVQPEPLTPRRVPVGWRAGVEYNNGGGATGRTPDRESGKETETLGAATDWTSCSTELGAVTILAAEDAGGCGDEDETAGSNASRSSRTTARIRSTKSSRPRSATR